MVVKNIIKQVMDVRVPLKLLAYLLNVSPCKLSLRASQLLLNILTMVKWLIATFWKCSSPPSSLDLHSRIREVRSMEYLTA